MADLNVIRTITIRARTDGVDAAKRSVEDLGVAYESSARRQLSVDRSLANLERRFVSGAREAQEFARVQRQVNLITAQQPELQGRATIALDAARKQLLGANDNTQKYTRNNQLARFELINLSRQIQDVGVGLASGQALTTVAIQQGSQIADVFASAGVSMGAFARQIVSMITPMRALIGVSVALAGAGVLLFANWKQTETLFLNLSDRLDTPINKLHELAQVAAVRGIDTTEFAKGMETFGDQVDRARLGLGQLAGLFRANGERAGDLTESLLKVADLVQNAASGAQRYRILQEAGLPPTAEWVRLLSQGSQQLKTQIEDTVKYNEANETLIRQAREFDEAWGKAWSNFKNNVSSAVASAIGGLSSMVDMAGRLVTGIQTGVLGLRGFTPEQAQRRLGEQALGAGAGTRFGLEDAADFYDRIKAAGGQASKDRTKLLTDTGALLSLEAQRIQMLGNLASTQEKIRLVEIQIQQARLQGVAITANEEQALLRVTAAQERARLSSETVAALGDAATLTEQYQATIDRLAVSLADTSISQETFNRAVVAANPLMRELNNTLESGVTQGLADISDGTKTVSQGFADMGKAIVRSLDEAIIKLLIVQPLVRGLQGAIGGFLPTFGAAVPQPHAGGIVGTTPFPMRIVDPLMMLNAPRLHGGLSSDEMFAVLQRGERIIPRGGAQGGEAVQNQINIINNTGAQISARESGDGRGGRRTDIMIDEAVSTAFGRPASRSVRALQSSQMLVNR